MATKNAQKEIAPRGTLDFLRAPKDSAAFNVILKPFLCLLVFFVAIHIRHKKALLDLIFQRARQKVFRQLGPLRIDRFANRQTQTILLGD